MQLNPTSKFISYELTEEEFKAAHSLNELQAAGIQNLLAQAAEDIMNPPIDFDDTSIVEIKRRAKLQGEMEAYIRLLNLNDATKLVQTQTN